MSLDQLLIDLHSEGQLHSQGAITLDPARAKALLASHQLSDARRFAFHLLAVALLDQATQIQIDCDDQHLCLSYQGTGLSAEDLQRCVGSLGFKLNDCNDLKLRHLALALAGASQWGATQFQVEARRNGNTQIEVRRRSTWNPINIFRKPSSEPELAILLSAGIVAPPVQAIRVNKKHMPALCQSPAILNLCLNGEQFQNDTSVLNLHYHKELPGWQTYGCIRWPARLIATRPSKLVVLGRCFEIPNSGLLSGADIVLHTMHFESDVTLENLNQEACNALLRQLSSIVEETFWNLSRDWRTLPQQDKLRELCLELWCHWLEQTQDNLRSTIQSALAALEHLPLFEVIGQSELMSLAQLDHMTEQSAPLYFCKAHYPQPDLFGRCTVWLADDRIENILRSKFQRRLKDNSWALQQVARTQSVREIFCHDPNSHCWAHLQLDPESDGGCQGLIGLIRPDSPLALLYHYHDKQPTPVPKLGIVGWVKPRNGPGRQIWFHIQLGEDPNLKLAPITVERLLLALRDTQEWPLVSDEFRSSVIWLLGQAQLRLLKFPESGGTDVSEWGLEKTQQSLGAIADLAVFLRIDERGFLSLRHLKSREQELGYLPVVSTSTQGIEADLPPVLAEQTHLANLFPFRDEALYRYGRLGSVIWRPLAWICQQETCAALYSVAEVRDQDSSYTAHFGAYYRRLHLALNLDPQAPAVVWHQDRLVSHQAAALPPGLFVGIDDPMGDPEHELPQILKHVLGLLPELLKRLHYRTQQGLVEEWVLQVHLFQLLTTLSWPAWMIPIGLHHIGWTRPDGHKFTLSNLLPLAPNPAEVVDPPALTAYATWAQQFGLVPTTE